MEKQLLWRGKRQMEHLGLGAHGGGGPELVGDHHNPAGTGLADAHGAIRPIGPPQAVALCEEAEACGRR